MSDGDGEGLRDRGLWAFRRGSTGRLVHTILAPSAITGSVTALEPAPALCLLAIAYADGTPIVSDVEADEKVLELRHKMSVRNL
jgi:hypothetical protein